MSSITKPPDSPFPVHVDLPEPQWLALGSEDECVNLRLVRRFWLSKEVARVAGHHEAQAVLKVEFDGERGVRPVARGERAREVYNRLVMSLPVLYVGKGPEKKEKQPAEAVNEVS